MVAEVDVKVTNGTTVPEKSTENAVENKAYSNSDHVDELSPELKASTASDGDDGKSKEKPVALPSVGMKELFRYATTTDWLFMFIGTIAAIGNGLAQPVSFIFFGEIIDKFIEQDSGTEIDIEDEMSTFALYYVYIAIATLVLGYFQNLLWLLSSIRQGFVIRTRCFEAVLRQDIGWFDITDSGEISTRMTDDITKIQNGIGDKIGSLIQAVSMLLGGFVIGFIYSWKLTLVIIALTPLIVMAAFGTGKVVGIITSEEQTSYAKAGAVAEEVLSSIRTVVAFGGEEKEIARYRKNLVDAERAGIKKGISTGFAFAVFNTVIFSCCAIGFWYGGQLVADEDITGGDLLIVFFSVMVGAAQLGQVGPNVEAIAIARGSAFYIYDLLVRVPVIDVMSDEGTKPQITGNIGFSESKFEYPSRPEVKILKGLTLDIKAGTTCALVGESGCGKSTTIKLVQRFYDVTSGAVYIDEEDIKKINVRYLREHIGVVSQEPVLFDMSIEKNIMMGNPRATREMVEKAAKDANAYDFIMKLPAKFDTPVGEGGAQLSGGQKQRIAIARALVRDPKILLLDEATSALDTESESIVQAALEKASEGRTTIIIAHRLSTVRKADLIAVVADGKIVETGKHEELMKNRGEYFKLVMLQTFEEEEVDQETSELASMLSETEREEIMRRKMERSMSQMSDHEHEHEKPGLHQQFSRQFSRSSTRRSMHSRQSLRRAVSKKEPEEEIIEEEVTNPPSIVRILKLNLKEWPFMLFGMFFAAISGAMPVVFAVILSEVLESFTFTEQKDKMKDESEFWSIMFMVLGFTIGIGYFIAQYLFAIAGEALTTRLREMAFRALLRQEIGYFDLPQHSTGALSARLASDASAVQGATSTRLNTLTQVVVMGLSSIIIAFVYSWKLTLVILAFVPFIGFAGAVQTKLNTSFAADEQKKISEAGSVATESIMQIRTVASLGQEMHFYNKFLQLLERPHKKSKRSAHFFGLSFGASFCILFLNNAAAFRFGGYLSANDGLSLADMMKVIIAVQFGSMTAGQLASFAPDHAKAKVAAGRILNLFDRVPPIDSYSEAGSKEPLDGNVAFKDVKFQYPNRPNVPVLQGLNVGVSKGQMLALVGSSGCGKSTTISLLERFYNVASGIVTIDGKPIESYNIRHLRREIGFVQQEPVLFGSSIRDNVLYGVEKNDFSQEDVEEACKDSNIHHFIKSLPKGYDTNVGDKGALISGGQKQRIAIARALIRDPKILLLDEATSALDSESEKIVQEALDRAMEGRTAIVIAHRLSTVQQADIIAVIQNGKVVEIGNHHELLALKGAYFLLNQAQL